MKIGKVSTLLFLMGITLLPITWMLLLSFKPNDDLMRGTKTAFQYGYTLRNYADVLLMSGLPLWIFNTFLVSTLSTVGVLIVSSLAAFGFARTRFMGRAALFTIMLFVLAVPEQSLIIARFEMFRGLGLHNSYFGLIVPHLAGAFGTFYLTQYFLGVPREITDAAIMDGATDVQIFSKVMVPLALPALTVVGICTFTAVWNEYWWPLLSSTATERLTLTVGLAASQKLIAQTNGLGYLMAQGMVACLPSFVIYILFQRHILSAARSAA